MPKSIYYMEKNIAKIKVGNFLHFAFFAVFWMSK